MQGDSKGKQKEECSESPMFCNKDCTVQKGNPDQGDRDYLYMQRDGLMNRKVSDIVTKSGMVHQPIIHFPVSTQKKPCCQEQQGCCREDRKKDSENAQS